MAQTKKCPKCGAVLQENAQFCLYCMTSFDTKQEIAKKKTLSRTAKRIIIISVSAAVLVAVCVAVILTVRKKAEAPQSKPVSKGVAVCSPEDFLERVGLASEKLSADGLWEKDAIKEIRHSSDGTIDEYSTELNIGNSLLSILFYDKGEQVRTVLWDVKEEELPDAKKLLICITDSICNNYFTDIEDVFFNERQYPRSAYAEPFVKDLTDFAQRTDAYNQAVQQGTKITTDYIAMDCKKQNIVLFVTERSGADGTLYDLAVYIESKDNQSN